MRLKVVTPERQEVVVIEDDATVGQLIRQLHDSGTTGTSAINIKAGFPPRLVDISDEEVKILDIGIRPGDKLIIELPKREVSDQEQSSSPLPKQIQKKEQLPTSTTPYIKIPNGYCALRKVPDDNSCLFRSISYAVFRHLEEGSLLRSVVAQAISEDPSTYNEVTLGRPVEEYKDWIMKPNSWGGAIELKILSDYLNVTIHTMDVESGKVISFNEDKSTFIYVIYSGIHYDTVAFTPLVDIDNHNDDITVFEESSDLASDFISGVAQLRIKLNNKSYVTNVNTFTIKCMTCGKQFEGEKSATAHAQAMGHCEFGEVN